jgi:hypothetical protein
MYYGTTVEYKNRTGDVFCIGDIPQHFVCFQLVLWEIKTG